MTNQKNEVLVVKRDYDKTSHYGGGIENYYQSLSKNGFQYDTFGVQGWADDSNFLTKIMIGLKDIFKLRNKIERNSYKVVIFNPSLTLLQIIYYFVIFVILRSREEKKVIFFRGWKNIFNSKFHWWKPFLKYILDKSDLVIVLANQFREKLEKICPTAKIVVETTTVNEMDLKLQNVSIENILTARVNKTVKNILFLSRIEEEKGVLYLIDAVQNTGMKNLNWKLHIAGKGQDQDKLKDKISSLDPSIKENIIYQGYVSGQEKRELFLKSHIFCFPTYYPEGLPNAILEAMAFGLPIITCPVGGIPEVVKPGENGYLVEPKDANKLSKVIKTILKDENKYKKISKNNFNLARKKFYSSVVTNRFTKIIRKLKTEKSREYRYK